MLWNETCSQHLDALPRDLLHNRRIVHEPPATERHQVAELTRVNAEFVLVLPAEHTHQKPIGWKVAAKIFQRPKVRSAQGVARQTQRWIDLFAHSNHERERQVPFAATRQHPLLQQSI